MARRVYFSFDYERDVWRTNQVRNSWVTKGSGEAAGFWDAAEFEEVKRKGKDAIRKWIVGQLQGTSVTVVLIGAKTSDSEWVNYEIEQSHQRGNGLLGIYIHDLKNELQLTDHKGENPFDNWCIEKEGKRVCFSKLYPTYDWGGSTKSWEITEIWD
jgi:hypothetical protein